MILTIIALAIPFLIGFFVVSLILRQEGSLPERLAFAFPAGAGLLTIQLFMAGWFGIPLELKYLLPVFTVEIIILFFPTKDYFLKNRECPHFLIGILMIKIITVFILTYLRPIYAWDSWANWSTGAKLFYSTKSLLLDNPEEFLGKGYVLRIISYPLHNPLMQTWIALFNGSFDEVFVKFWSPLYLLSMTLYLFWFISKSFNPFIAVFGLIIFLSSPLMNYHSTEVYSDICLSAYLFFALISFYNITNGKEGYFILAALFSAEALFVKDEALFFVTPLILSAIIHLWSKRAISNKTILKAALMFIYILPWYIFKFTNKLSLGAEVIDWRFVFQPDAITGIFMNILTLQNFNLVFIAFPILLILCPKIKKETILLLLPVAMYGLFFFCLYVFTSFYYEHFLSGTVFFRNLLTYYPSVFFINILLIKDIKMGTLPNFLKNH
jgi:hypothetical protein